MSGELIRTEAVSKVYHRGRPDQVRALDGVSVAVRRGEVVVLEGPSGSGKTSLLSLMGCMSRPTSGRVVVEDRDVSRLSEESLTGLRRRRFGFVFQQYHLLAECSVLENVILPLYPEPVGFRQMARRATDILARLGLEGKARRRARDLSGGEQQRVAVARALVNDPDVVIADEPTAHLDRTLSLELLGILEELNRGGRTIVIATHDPLAAEHPMVKRRVGMRDGRVVGEPAA